ncbi:uncharacterized protein BX663DRAFT_491377, partial [Cokeromyces recurvatus]|uniref:uncharacterized protein n=1 Tax=Cokeromyces recurvatus TaxID=90255 RepID=UPI002220E270
KRSSYPIRKRTWIRSMCGSKIVENVQRNRRSALQKSSFNNDYNDFLRNLVDDEPLLA